MRFYPHIEVDIEKEEEEEKKKKTVRRRMNKHVV
jgi:hypothetical protein